MNVKKTLKSDNFASLPLFYLRKAMIQIFHLGVSKKNSLSPSQTTSAPVSINASHGSLLTHGPPKTPTEIRKFRRPHAIDCTSIAIDRLHDDGKKATPEISKKNVPKAPKIFAQSVKGPKRAPKGFQLYTMVALSMGEVVSVFTILRKR